MNVWDFSLELITRLTPIALALIVWLQMRVGRRIREVAESVNGMKSELVAATAKGAYLEGAASVGSPEAAKETLNLAAEVAKDVLATAEGKARK